MQHTLQALSKEFEVNIMHTNKFLGYQYLVQPNGDVCLHQANYINDVLTRYGMNESKPVNTPIFFGQSKDDDSPFDDLTKCREIIGSLQYAASQTRLDMRLLLVSSSAK